MERGICPIAVLYFAVKRSFCSIEKLYWSTRVRMLPTIFVSRHRSRHYKIRSGWFPIGGPLTPTIYTVSPKKHETTFSTITLTIGVRLQQFFGIVSSKSMRHQKMVSFPTSPI